MNEKMRQLREAVLNDQQEVEVTPTGEVRPRRTDPEPRAQPEREDEPRPTKLSARTFGRK